MNQNDKEVGEANRAAFKTHDENDRSTAIAANSIQLSVKQAAHVKAQAQPDIYVDIGSDNIAH